MRILHFCLLFGAGILMMFSSCTRHPYYATNSHQVPMFQEKDDAHLNLNFISGSQYAGLEIQGAYALTNRIAARASHTSGSGSGAITGPMVSTTTAEGEGKYTEFGLGYFRPLSNGFTVESFGGWGFGRIRNFYAGGGFSDIKYHKTYIQPAIGYNTRWAELIFSYRIGFLQYYQLRQNAIVSNEHSADLDQIANDSQAVLSEYAVTVRAQFSFYKLHFQFGKAAAINRPELPMDDLTVNIGLTLELHYIWKGREKFKEVY